MPQIIRPVPPYRRNARRWALAVPVLALALLAAASAQAQVTVPLYPGQTCAADRAKNKLNCTANDIQIAGVSVVGGPSSCLAGSNVTLDLNVSLHVNAQDMHDVGIFIAQDGKSPIVPSADGGSASCGVAGIPFSPPPFANIDTAFPGNQCGDFHRNGLPQGTIATEHIGSLTVACTADPVTGHVVLPSVVTWDPSSEPICTVPDSLGAETGAKCEAANVVMDLAVHGRIEITKQTVPAGAPGSFSYTATGGAVTPTSFSLTSGQTRVLDTGALTSSAQPVAVTEALLAGFNSAAQISCTDKNGAPAGFVTVDSANRTMTVQMSANPAVGLDQVFCTFTNTQGPTVVIQKHTLGGDGTFSFTGSRTFNITTSNGSGEFVIPNLAAGTYTVTETNPAPTFDFTSLNCSDPTSDTTTAGATATIHISGNETVTCTFHNTKRGSLTVRKQTVPAAGTFFSFTTTGLTPGAFSLVNGGSQLFPNLSPGITASVTETVAAGYVLTAIDCSDIFEGSANRSTVNLATATLTPHIGAGENLDCTFTNTLATPGTITVTKHTLGGDGSFPFTNNGGAFTTIVTSGGSGSFQSGPLPAGTYNLVEVVPTGWRLTQPVTCVVTVGSNTTITPIANGVSIGLGTTGINVDAVSCDFRDTAAALVTNKIPALGEWAMAILATFLLGIGAVAARERARQRRAG